MDEESRKKWKDPESSVQTEQWKQTRKLSRKRNERHRGNNKHDWGGTSNRPLETRGQQTKQTANVTEELASQHPGLKRLFLGAKRLRLRTPPSFPLPPSLYSTSLLRTSAGAPLLPTSYREPRRSPGQTGNLVHSRSRKRKLPRSRSSKRRNKGSILRKWGYAPGSIEFAKDKAKCSKRKQQSLNP